MVIMHANGDIVTMPDHAINYKRRQAKYEKEHKCRHGVICANCPDYLAELRRITEYERKNNKPPTPIDYTHCNCQDNAACSKYASQVYVCNQPKKYKIGNKQYRKIADRAAYMKEHNTHKLLFITLTFGNFKKPLTDEDANKCFSNYMDNLKKNYGRKNYIAVREHGENFTKRVHFHCIIELPFIDFTVLNSSWCNAISNFCYFSKNALTTKRNAIFIKSTVQAIRYICKYVSKCRGNTSTARLIFCSKELSQAVTEIDFSGHQFKPLLKEFKSIQVHKLNDFCWRYSISYPPKADELQKQRTRIAENAYFYQIVRAMFSVDRRKKSDLQVFLSDNSS